MIRISSLACVAAAALTVSACNPTPATDGASTTNPVSEVQQSQAAAAAVLGTLGGGGSNPTMTAYVSNLDKVATALSNVKDEASAKAMGEQLAPIFAEMQKQSETLEKMSDQQIAAAAMASAPQLIAAQTKIAQAASTWMLQNPELGEIISKELEKMPELKD
jgi:hypothetical protein